VAADIARSCFILIRRHETLKEKPMILVTGASGKLGRAVVRELAARVAPAGVVAGSRTPREAAEHGDVQTRFVDFDVPASLEASLQGVETVLVIPTAAHEARRRLQHRAAIEAYASVPVVAYASLLGADRHGDNALLETHALAEADLRRRQQPSIVFRNGVYLESLPMLLAGGLQGGVIDHPAGDGKVSLILRSEIAAAIATRLTQPATEAYEVIELVGERPHGFGELARHVAKLLGREIRYAPASIAAYRASLAAVGMPPHAVDAFVEVCQAIAAGRLAGSSTDAARLLGRTPTGALDYLDSALTRSSP